MPLESAGITYTVKREAAVRLTPAIPAQEAEEGGLLLAWGHPGLQSKLQTSLVYRMRNCFFCCYCCLPLDPAKLPTRPCLENNKGGSTRLELS